jgi:OOP family OmpA-OmpF porin
MTSPAVPPKPPVPRLYALESDALFEFGKDELRANSYNAIEIMAQRLKRDFTEVERIRVVGHTDAIGKPKSNAKLSMERAKVVAQQLQERGLRPTKGFKVEGEGSTHLVKLKCGNSPTPENKLCHAPNRRVEIIVTGAKR